MRGGASGITESPGTHVLPSFCSACLAPAALLQAVVQCGCRSSSHHVSIPGSGQVGGGGRRIDSLQHTLQKFRPPLLVGQVAVARPHGVTVGPGWRGGS